MPRKPARKATTRAKPKKKTAAKPTSRRKGALRRVLAVTVLLSLVAFAAYLLYLNRIIDSRFEGGA